MLIFVLASCGKGKDAKETQEQPQRTIPTAVTNKPAEVSVTPLSIKDFNYELISNGTVISKRKAELKFQSSENILHIYVKNGDRVANGQKLAELDLFKLQNSYYQAKHNIEKAQLDFENELIGRGHAIKDTANIPAEEIRLAKIRSNYDQTLINFHRAEYDLKAGTLYAPFSGVIANLFVTEHNLPGADPFCTIIDDKSQEVVFFILENELPVINIGDKVVITPFAMETYSMEGKVSEINPLIDKNGMVRVKALVNNPSGKLFEGMNVKIRVQRFISKQLVIPKTALVLRTNRKVVFRYSKGKAWWVYVETAQENSESYVVTSGLAEGDSIIYKGNFNLADETPVIIVDSPENE
jgi:RND family efflux transporter MFP subunit